MWRQVGQLSQGERNLLKGTSGHPVMVFYDEKNNKRQIVGETGISGLNQHYSDFKKDISKPSSSGRPSSYRSGSGVVCY